MKPSELEARIVAAYREGKKVTSIEQEFGIDRRTLYHVLKRSGLTPNRRPHERDSRDATVAGLYELIRHQDRRIEELIEERDRLARQVKRLERRGPTRMS